MSHGGGGAPITYPTITATLVSDGSVVETIQSDPTTSVDYRFTSGALYSSPLVGYSMYLSNVGTEVNATITTHPFTVYLPPQLTNNNNAGPSVVSMNSTYSNLCDTSSQWGLSFSIDITNFITTSPYFTKLGFKVPHIIWRVTLGEGCIQIY